MFQLTIQKLPGREQNANSLLLFVHFEVRFQAFVFTRVYMICEIDFDDLTQSFDMSYDIHIYVTSSNLTQPLSPQKMLVSSTNSQPKKEKHIKNQSPKKND